MFFFEINFVCIKIKFYICGMTKKKETSSEAKVVKEAKPKKEVIVDPVVDETSVDTAEAYQIEPESTISPDVTLDTKEEKESLTDEITDENVDTSFASIETDYNIGSAIKNESDDSFYFQDITTGKEYFYQEEFGAISETVLTEDHKKEDGWGIFELSDIHAENLGAFFKDLKEQEESVDPAEAYKEEQELKALYHAPSYGSSYKPVTKEATVADLKKNKNLDKNHSQTSFYLLENGLLYSASTASVTTKDESNILNSLKNNK